MTPQEWEKMLRQTLADLKMSGGERTALEQALAEARPDEQKKAALRAVAFGLAREAMSGPRPAEVLDWLEGVVKLLHPVVSSARSAPSQALFAPFDNLWAMVVRLFHDAKASADVCVFTITDDRIAEALLAAHRRGVRVRVITDDEKALDRGSDIDRIIEAGVPVRRDDSPAHMHHKFAIFDGEFLLNGSYNWTRSAGAENNENLTLSSEPGLVAQFARHFEKLWELMA
jgi:phosphatidylserine/phosphatidylglycerophosphate/cardiolipin synthase-like enzyme